MKIKLAKLGISN